MAQPSFSRQPFRTDTVAAASAPTGVASASWISIHNGGGVGIGYSQHAGMVVVADGTENSKRRLERVLTSDPGMGVLRHADAGYSRAIDFAKANDVRVPIQPTVRD